MKQTRIHIVKVECTSNYDPYYGFKVIQQGFIGKAEVDPTHYLVRILDERGCILGTASQDEFALHFAVSL